MSDARKLQLSGIPNTSTSIAVLNSEYHQEKSQTSDQPMAPNTDSHNTIKVKQPALSSLARSMIAKLERTPITQYTHVYIVIATTMNKQQHNHRSRTDSSLGHRKGGRGGGVNAFTGQSPHTQLKHAHRALYVTRGSRCLFSIR